MTDLPVPGGRAPGPLPVLVAAGGAPWEAGLLAAFARPAVPVTVVRRCVDVVDLIAVAASGQGRSALVAASLLRLDADAVDRLTAAEVVPVAVVARGDQATEDRMRAIGIEYLVPSDADGTVVANVLLEAVEAGARRSDGGDGAGSEPYTARMFGDPAQSMALPPGSSPEPAHAGPDRDGTVVAVWGATGAPGRTTIAVTLADELARLGAHTLLVDADVYGGTVAASLGLLDESPGLAAACRQATSSRLDGAALARSCWQLNPRLRVLTGLTLAARWTELRPPAVTAVLGAARRLAEFTVVDCGFCLETDEELSFDTIAPRRNGATLAVLDAADVVLVVGAADPIGMQRLVRGLAELRDAEIAAPVRVVLNRVRRGAVPGDPAAELSSALQQFAGHVPSALLPYDRESVDAALAVGRAPRREPSDEPAACGRGRSRRRAVRTARDHAAPPAAVNPPARRVTQRRSTAGLRGSTGSTGRNRKDRDRR